MISPMYAARWTVKEAVLPHDKDWDYKHSRAFKLQILTTTTDSSRLLQAHKQAQAQHKKFDEVSYVTGDLHYYRTSDDVIFRASVSHSHRDREVEQIELITEDPMKLVAAASRFNLPGVRKLEDEVEAINLRNQEE